jgi:hypothetical protein
MGRQFSGVVNENPPCRDLNTVRVRFLWMEIDNNASICDSLTFGDTFDVIMSHDKNRVSAFLSHLIVTFSHAAKIFPKHSLPHF